MARLVLLHVFELRRCIHGTAQSVHNAHVIHSDPALRQSLTDIDVGYGYPLHSADRSAALLWSAGPEPDTGGNRHHGGAPTFVTQ